VRSLTTETIRLALQQREEPLTCTHARLCLPIIQRLHRKMLAGIKFPAIKVVGSLIIDGHHRYVAALMADYELEMVPYATTSTTRPTEWADVEFDTEDWDTEARIRLCNRTDAQFNGIPMEQMERLL
jgi:hypothetical protein